MTTNPATPSAPATPTHGFSPDSLAARDPRGALKLLSSALIKVHKTLIDAELASFGAVDDPYQRLDLVSNHPQFVWLKAFSNVILAIDENRGTRRLPPPDVDDVAGHVTTVASLTGVGPATDAADNHARLRYLERMSTVPAVTVAHGVLKQIVDRLHHPAPDAAH